MPGNWSLLLTGILTLWILEDTSCQGTRHPITILIVPVAAVLFLSWLIQMVKTQTTYSAGPARRRAPGQWRWLVLPLATILSLSALVTHWPLTLRFAMSKTAFERTVEEFRRNGSIETGPRRVGWYWISAIRALERDQVGFETGTSICDPVGITFDPSNPPSNPFHLRICENWYAEEW